MWSFARTALQKRVAIPAQDDVDLAISPFMRSPTANPTDRIGDASATSFTRTFSSMYWSTDAPVGRKHVRLAKASRDRFTIHEVLFTYACDRLKLSEDMGGGCDQAIGSPGYW